MRGRIVAVPSTLLALPAFALLLAVPNQRVVAQSPDRTAAVPASTRQTFPVDPTASVPGLRSLMSSTTGEMADVVSRFAADAAALQRRYDTPGSTSRRNRLEAFFVTWRDRLKALDFAALSHEGKVDYVLLDNHLRYQLDLMARDDQARRETTVLVPFAPALLALQEERRDLRTVNGQQAARLLAAITKQVDSLRLGLEPAPARAGDSATRAPRAVPKVSRTVANRAADEVDQVRTVVTTWYRYYNGYDPLFSWWVSTPWERLDESLRRYAQTIRQRLVGIPMTTTVAAGGSAGGGTGAAPGGGGAPAARNAAAANEPIIGDPIGAEGLAMDLRHAMIPYSAEELIAIAEREYAFSEAEAKKAAR